MKRSNNPVMGLMLAIMLLHGVAYAENAVTEREEVFVKGGCFKMGNTFGDGNRDERPVHTVCVSDFYIDRYEVTQEQWKTVMGTNPSKFKDCRGNCPVENVSWKDAMEFMEAFNKKTGKKYRLPTEAEWEYAARSGGLNEKYAGGTSDLVTAWYNDNSVKIYAVGQKKPNGLGLYDMTENVWEWVSDWYDSDYYSKSPRDNPKGPVTGGAHVLRGGSWAYKSGLHDARAIRMGTTTRRATSSSASGFRCARTP